MSSRKTAAGKRQGPFATPVQPTPQACPRRLCTRPAGSRDRRLCLFIGVWAAFSKLPLETSAAQPTLARMAGLKENLLELIRRTSAEMPDDIHRVLVESLQAEEKRTTAEFALKTIHANIEMAARKSQPRTCAGGMP